MAYIFINGYTRKYYKTINVPAEYEDFTLPYLTSNTSYGTVTCSSEHGEYLAYKAFDGNSSTWWETNEGVKSATWQWVLPVEIYITGIKIQVRTGDRPNLTARVYTSSAKTQAIGNSVTTTTAGQVVTVSGIPSDGIKTNTIFIDCSSTQDYLGIGEITITAKKLVKASYSYETEGTAEDYDRYVDVPNTLIPVNGYTRKYYKTITVNVPEETQTFTQPVLSANGTLGGNSFAVSASGENQSGSNPYRAYEAFDNNASTYWRCSNTTSGWIQFYNPKPLHVSTLKWGYFYSYPTGGSVLGSNDGTNFDTLTTWTNSSAADFTITVNSTKAYKYYRITVTGVNTDVVHCKDMTITATEVIKEAYSYSQEVESTIDDYDRYEDVLNIFEVRI